MPEDEKQEKPSFELPKFDYVRSSPLENLLTKRNIIVGVSLLMIILLILFFSLFLTGSSPKSQLTSQSSIVSTTISPSYPTTSKALTTNTINSTSTTKPTTTSSSIPTSTVNNQTTSTGTTTAGTTTTSPTTTLAITTLAVTVTDYITVTNGQVAFKTPYISIPSQDKFEMINETTASLVWMINGTSYTIPSGQNVVISLSPGVYPMSVQNTSAQGTLTVTS